MTSHSLSLAATSVVIVCSLAGSASNARSSSWRSQTTLELITFGAGILPSLTISSKRVGETPMYAADSDRESPRGGQDVGRISGRARFMKISRILARGRRIAARDVNLPQSSDPRRGFRSEDDSPSKHRGSALKALTPADERGARPANDVKEFFRLKDAHTPNRINGALIAHKGRPPWAPGARSRTPSETGHDLCPFRTLPDAGRRRARLTESPSRARLVPRPRSCGCAAPRAPSASAGTRRRFPPLHKRAPGSLHLYQ
jgi:hypothetical protein